MSYQGKVVVVTGAAGGIGSAIALRLARAGADLALGDIRFEGQDQFAGGKSGLQAELEAIGARSIVVESDLSTREGAAELMARSVEAFGRIDALVAAAGGAITPQETSMASVATLEDMEKLFAANYRSAVFSAQEAVPSLKAAGGGAIVIIASAAGSTVLPGGLIAHYLASKEAVKSYARSLAGEVGPEGIRVNTIAPGLVMSPRLARVAGERGLTRLTSDDSIPLRRFGEVDDVAKVVEFLAGDLAGYVTGQCIAVNGGATLSPS
jgi:NAD(P)-dependent dehydrogenase (short-subunit alcohol dehydrogenase family)